MVITIYLESKQSGSEAGLPDDLSMNVVLLMSGTKLTTGNLTAKGISIITEIVTTNTQYNTAAIKGAWWMWEADFDLQTEVKSVKIRLESGNTNQTMKDLMSQVILQKIKK
jgi:hypothetical protein